MRFCSICVNCYVVHFYHPAECHVGCGWLRFFQVGCAGGCTGIHWSTLAAGLGVSRAPPPTRNAARGAPCLRVFVVGSGRASHLVGRDAVASEAAFPRWSVGTVTKTVRAPHWGTLCVTGWYALRTPRNQWVTRRFLRAFQPHGRGAAALGEHGRVLP